MMIMPSLSGRGRRLRCLLGWGKRLGWVRGGGVGGRRLVAYSSLLGATGARAPFSPCSPWWDWRWWDRTWVGLEVGLGSLLIGVLKRGFCRCLHGRLQPVSCEVGEFLYCFLGVCGPW